MHVSTYTNAHTNKHIETRTQTHKTHTTTSKTVIGNYNEHCKSLAHIDFDLRHITI